MHASLIVFLIGACTVIYAQPPSPTPPPSFPYCSCEHLFFDHITPYYTLQEDSECDAVEEDMLEHLIYIELQFRYFLEAEPLYTSCVTSTPPKGSLEYAYKQAVIDFQALYVTTCDAYSYELNPCTFTCLAFKETKQIMVKTVDWWLNPAYGFCRSCEGSTWSDDAPLCETESPVNCSAECPGTPPFPEPPAINCSIECPCEPTPPHQQMNCSEYVNCTRSQGYFKTHYPYGLPAEEKTLCGETFHYWLTCNCNHVKIDYPTRDGHSYYPPKWTSIAKQYIAAELNILRMNEDCINPSLVPGVFDAVDQTKMFLESTCYGVPPGPISMTDIIYFMDDKDVLEAFNTGLTFYQEC